MGYFVWDFESQETPNHVLLQGSPESHPEASNHCTVFSIRTGARWTSSIIKHIEPLTLEEKEQLVEDFAGVSSNE